MRVRDFVRAGFVSRTLMGVMAVAALLAAFLGGVMGMGKLVGARGERGAAPEASWALAVRASSGVGTGSDVIEASDGWGAGGLMPSPSAAAGLAPAAADVVLVIDRASELADLPEGRATVRLLREMGLFAGTAIAWNELAGVLGLSPEDAMDAIAGRRVMLVIREETPLRPLGWAMLTRVSPETERLLRTRLGPVPKRMADGQPVLALEGGRFLLATRVPPRKRGGDERSARDAVVLIAPADASDFFEACLPLLGDRPAADPLMRDADMGRLGDRTGDDAYLVYRPRIDEEPGSGRSLVALGARRVEGGWDVGFSATPAMFGEQEVVEGGAVARGLFERASERALFAVALPLGSGDARDGVFGRLFGRFLGDLMEGFDGSGMFVLRERAMKGGDGGATYELVIGARVREQSAEEWTSTPAQIDRAMATTIGRLARRPGSGVEGEDFGGYFPGAVREVELARGSLLVVGSLVGDSPLVRWCYTGFDGEGGGAKWWLAQVMDSGRSGESGGSRRGDGSTLRLLASRVGDGGQGDVGGGDVVTAGVVRPAMVLGLLPPTLVTVMKPLMPAKWIDRIEWWGGMDDGGLISGDARVRFTDEARAE